MIVTFILLCVAAAGIVAYATSALVGLLAVASRKRIESRTPAAQARVYFGLAVAPLVVTLAALCAALAPALGWIADHCTSALDLHAHPHICMHHESVLPAWPIWLIAALFLARAGWQTMRRGQVGFRALRAERELLSASTQRGSHRVLRGGEPFAFVLGFLTPTIFVSEGLLSLGNKQHAAAVLAHEESHSERRDPLRRLIAGFALALHLPFLSTLIEDRLALAHERAADEDAAGALGSRTRVAEALVELTRLSCKMPPLATAFHAHAVELRVKALLRDPSELEGPRLTTLLVVGAAFVAFVAASADTVHHGVEMMLGLLGG